LTKHSSLDSSYYYGEKYDKCLRGGQGLRWFSRLYMPGYVKSLLLGYFTHGAHYR